jgi:hypothetical protein
VRGDRERRCGSGWGTQCGLQIAPDGSLHRCKGHSAGCNALHALVDKPSRSTKGSGTEQVTVTEQNS